MPNYTGTAANDTLAGSAGADTLTGLNGNDTYTVNDLGDVIIEAGTAGSGIDTVRSAVLDSLSTYSLGWWANVENLFYTGALAAQLKGNALANLVSANSLTATSDTLYGGAGNDTLNAFGGSDMLIGGTGHDVLDGGTGIDTMIGGTGNDAYALDAAGDRVFEYAGGGFDTIVSAVAKDLRLAWTQQIEALTYNGTTAAVLHGNALGNRIESVSATNDTLHGYAGDDTLDGGNGTDSMLGGAGNDFYLVSLADLVSEIAGEGTDTFIGAKTNLSVAAYATTIENLFFTGAAGASLTGNALINLISGGNGADTVNGGSGDDSLLGGAGSDSLIGGTGNDLLYGGGLEGYVIGQPFVSDAVPDTLAGGTGDDRYLIDSTLDVVSEGAAGGTFDVVISAIDNSLVRYANVEALVLQAGTAAWFGQGTGGNDVIVGNESDNYLNGGLGNDTLSGYVDVANILEPQSDVIEAGGGNDVLVVFGFGSSFTASREVSLFGGTGNDLYVLGGNPEHYGGQDTGGTDTAVLVASGSIDNLEGIENLVLYGADAGLDASARAALASVYAAANAGAVYSGSIGNAYDATGNALANTITGNALDNRLVGGAGNDTITGGLGHDTLEGGTGTDSLTGGGGNDHYFLDTGDIVVEAVDGGYDILNSLTITGFTGYANVEGLRYLGAAAVNLNRGAANTSADYLVGGTGNDTVTGYAGNDSLGGDAGNDTVNGGAGQDVIYGDAGDDSLLGGTENDSMFGGDGIDTVRGELGDDTLEGGAGDDVIDGGGNWDRLYGGDGNDEMSGGDGEDYLNGDRGNDILYGEAQNDRLNGGGGNDVLSGGAVELTTMYGGNGDHLFGDDDDDPGTEGADVFYFDSVTVTNGITESFNGSGEFNFYSGATIGDFQQGIDSIGVPGAFVGNVDAVIDGVATVNAAGGTFDDAAELVLFRANVADSFAYSANSFFDPISAAALDTVIGNADAAIGVNETRLFVVDDGVNSAVFLFQSANGDAAVTMDELYLLTVVTAQSSLVSGDFLLG